jgi:PAS domain S-box-containing protein
MWWGMEGPEGSIAKEPIIIHETGTVIYASPMVSSLLETESRDSMLGDSLLNFVPEADRDTLAEQFEQAPADDTPPLGVATTLQRGGAEPKQVILVSSPVEWDGQDCLQTLIINTDAHLPAGLSAETMDATPVGISIADATLDDNPHIYVNDGFVDLTGYPREEVLGRNCRFLQGDKTEAEPVAELRQGIENEQPVTVELRNYRKDGSMFWNRVTVTPITTDDGEVSYYLGFQEDISARKAYEQEKALFETQADSVDKSILITDSDGTIQYVNSQFERTTGYSAQEAIGQTPRILKSGEHDQAFYEELWATITAGEVWEADITNRRKSGERYQAHQNIIPVTDADGGITHFVAIEDDITESQFVDEVLDVMERVLRHNVRTSVQVIEGYAEVLEQSGLDSDGEAALQMIREQARNLNEMSDRAGHIRDLFQNRHESHTIPVAQLADIVAEYRDQYPSVEIDLSIEAAETLDVQHGDLLQVALDEALANAIGHNTSPQPHIAVTVEQLRDEPDIRITIADNGPGIPEQERAAIASGRETQLVHGTGIGLWTMYWTLTALGGTMELAENDPQGTRVMFRVPTAETEQVTGWSTSEGTDI